MKFQANTTVKLSPFFTGADGSHSPVWGGKEGFIGGLIKKVCTHKHTDAEHFAVIEWFNGMGGEFKEEHLMNLTEEENQFSRDYLAKKGSSVKDIFILLKMKSGRFVLNFIESRASYANTGLDVGLPRYTTMLTKHALEKVSNSDYDMVEKALSFPDMKQVDSTTVFGAEACFFNGWNMQLPRTIYHPLPTYSSISDAANKSPQEWGIGAYAFFHLPKQLIDYSMVDAS